MIRAEFLQSEGKYRGFRVKGHAGYAESGQDIVCAAVTSACMLAANIITDGFHISAKVLKNGKAKKITVFTYKPKKGEKRKQGHRQPYTQVKIEAIKA